MHTVTKQYRDLPAAHRQHNHEGHCRLIHGHNFGFDITFTARELDYCGFVVDVGALGEVRAWLERVFDHTLLLNQDDPYLTALAECLEGEDPDKLRFAKIVTVPNCGMEGLAKLVFEKVGECLNDKGKADRGLAVLEVRCWEDSKNSATFREDNYEAKSVLAHHI